MPKPLLKLLFAVAVTIGGHYLLFALYPDADKSQTLTFTLSLLGNVIAAFMYVWVLSLTKQVELSSNGSPNVASAGPAHWSRPIAIGVLAIITLTAAVLSQWFVDAVWMHSQEMVDAKLLTPEGKQRLGIYFLGLVPMMVWAPLVTYTSLSVGRRSVYPPKYVDHIIGAALGLGAVVIWNAITDYRAGAPVWQVLPRIPGDTEQMRAYDNAIGYVLQIGTFAAVVILYSGWTKVWSSVGGVLHRRGLA